MRKQTSSLILGLLATLAMAQPMHALADSKGGKSGSSSRSESRSGGAESHSSRGESQSGGRESSGGGRSEYSSRSESRTGDSGRHGESHAKNERSEKGERHGDERYGHERGEGRGDWDAGRHQQSMAMGANRSPMTPEAAALMTQARQAAFEYRTTGNPDSLAALQSLRASLAGMGFSRTTHGHVATPAPIAPAPTAPVANAPAPVGAPTGTPVAAGTSGVTVQ